MFSSSRLLFAFGTTTMLRLTPRSTGAIRKKKDTPPFGTATESKLPETSSSSQHVDVFPSVKESLDRLLGEADKTPTDERNPQTTSLQVPSFYNPMDIRGQLYDVEIAGPLRRAAANRWRSPVWATRAAFARSGHKVRADETGVRIPTNMQEVEMYNLEQTDAPDGVISRSLAREEMMAANRMMPLNAAGNRYSLWVRRILERHPSFRQYTSPYWATEEEVEMLGTKVKRSQEGCGILIQHFSSASSGNAATSSISSGVEEEKAESKVPNNQEENVGTASSNNFFMLYNAEQLENPEKMTSETCPPTECLNINGRRYSIAVTICMRQYCQKYNLRMQPFAMFVTSARVRVMGGDLLPRENAVPPFTCVIKDELVTFYHADQTTISDQLNAMALTRRRERMDRIPATIL
ncbi:uncharacterized protein TM35_000281090 [Trypanosoma theileri]|uniref:Uncharacterized protein n=1 Tax=Trypanosoma theileri TaxID=67003 RepID=A0A1X0NPH7_9TRYP|nr:uncharacterized protein TM35_000281090 [Trypanosoma theileri]ORC86393.1 hypothetical protein TM35_000281090 [Trypanosoma theileri]